MPRAQQRTFTEAQKKEIMDYADEHGVAAAVSQFDVWKSSIYRWRRLKWSKRKVRAPYPPKKVMKRAVTSKPPKSLSIDEVIAYLTEQRDKAQQNLDEAKKFRDMLTNLL